MRFSSNFSNTLDILEVMKLAFNSGVFLGLRIIVTFACFYTFGTCVIRNVAFIKSVSNTIAFFRNFFNMLLISFCSAVEFILSKHLETSGGVMNFISSCILKSRSGTTLEITLFS